MGMPDFPDMMRKGHGPITVSSALHARPSLVYIAPLLCVIQ